VNRPVVVERTAPLQKLTIAGELEARQIKDRAAGRMFARNPLRIIERERAG